ncbi:aflatoxin B1 aldehyde reductase member 2 [Trematosphaeria pertusa]|uniref:Aflatoxin B1 aldehyde reductase member 2 n=1 Tax=Trematosphaeria pertusa TaxID=390896 RepID=A0A6A6I7Z9_9PLEO|nr:aflatoxin B1 aldehyde reductase member 2 [Trematosphaeria pertusa]KAF2246208.1 aflatoxin B1 aldehyde reductase member 2 [Trematosphaeria pertusa]
MQIKAVFGGAALNPHGAFSTDAAVQEAFALLKREGVTTLDTARLYPGSEETIGRSPGHESFIIDTKLLGGFGPGSLKRDAVLADAQDSLKRCQIDQFDILYLHAPDATVPIEETLEAVNEVYKKGLFKRFGLSNYTAEQVQEVYDVAKAKGYVLPSVYQGNYSPVARHLEFLLFPTLRKLNMVFYAYSPLAGGFLTKTPADLDAGAGRFNAQAIGGMYKNLYDKPALREALGEWSDIAAKEGTSKAELAYRWVGYNSAMKAELGDAVIFGASSLKQIEQTVQGLKKGGLSKEAAERIEQLWEKVKDVAPIDNWNSTKRD